MQALLSFLYNHIISSAGLYSTFCLRPGGAVLPEILPAGGGRKLPEFLAGHADPPLRSILDTWICGLTGRTAPVFKNTNFFENRGLTFIAKSCIIYEHQAQCLERWLSWSKAHDWKSCVGYKPTEGSNPSLSARKTPTDRKICRGFCYTIFSKECFLPWHGITSPLPAGFCAPA